MKFGTIIKNKRLALDISQDELAERVDVTRQAVQKWETKNTLPRPETLIKLLAILQLHEDTDDFDSDMREAIRNARLILEDRREIILKNSKPKLTHIFRNVDFKQLELYTALEAACEEYGFEFRGEDRNSIYVACERKGKTGIMSVTGYRLAGEIEYSAHISVESFSRDSGRHPTVLDALIALDEKL